MSLAGEVSHEHILVLREPEFTLNAAYNCINWLFQDVSAVTSLGTKSTATFDFSGGLLVGQTITVFGKVFNPVVFLGDGEDEILIDGAAGTQALHFRDALCLNYEILKNFEVVFENPSTVIIRARQFGTEFSINPAETSPNVAITTDIDGIDFGLKLNYNNLIAVWCAVTENKLFQVSDYVLANEIVKIPFILSKKFGPDLIGGNGQELVGTEGRIDSIVRNKVKSVVVPLNKLDIMLCDECLLRAYVTYTEEFGTPVVKIRSGQTKTVYVLNAGWKYDENDIKMKPFSPVDNSIGTAIRFLTNVPDGHLICCCQPWYLYFAVLTPQDKGAIIRVQAKLMLFSGEEITIQLHKDAVSFSHVIGIPVGTDIIPCDSNQGVNVNIFTDCEIGECDDSVGTMDTDADPANGVLLDQVLFLNGNGSAVIVPDIPNGPPV